MTDSELKLIRLEMKMNEMESDFSLLRRSISRLPSIALVCFLSGLTAGALLILLLGFL